MRNSNIRSPPLNLSQQMHQPSYPMSLSQQLTPSSQMGYPGMNNYYGEQRYVEQIPYEKKTVDYYPQEKVEYIPQEKKYEDFLEVQHELDYVPVPRLEKYTEHVPLERFDTYYDYMPRQTTVVKSTGSNYVPPPNQYPGPGSQYLGPSQSHHFGPNYSSSYNHYSGFNQYPGSQPYPSQGSFGYGPQRYGSQRYEPQRYEPQRYGPQRYEPQRYGPQYNISPVQYGSQFGSQYPMTQEMRQRPISANRAPYYPEMSPYSGYSKKQHF